jgi:signal transduction histidine kinase/ligand-binding sensor domain-containing protein
MNKIKLGFLLIFFASITGNSFAQQPQFNVAVSDKGNNYGSIYSIVQDLQGYIWFNSFTSGLFRYDGREFKRYKHDPENPNSPASTLILTMAVDSSGNLWLANIGAGLDRYDPSTNTFTHFRHRDNDSSSIMSDTVTALMADHSGNIWVGTTLGLDRYNSETGKFIHIKKTAATNSPGLSSTIFEILEDRKGKIWFGTMDPGAGKPTTPGGLFSYEPVTGNYSFFGADRADTNKLINPNITAIFEDSKGNFWIGTKGDGLHTLDRTTGKFTRHRYDPSHPEKLSRPVLVNADNDFISFIKEDARGRIWIGTLMSGINSYDPATQKISHFGSVEDEKKKEQFAKDTLSGFKDFGAARAMLAKDGLLWLCGARSSIYTMTYGRKNIPFFPNNEAVNSFYLEPGGKMLWFGTDKGLVRKNLQTDEIKTWSHDPANSKSINKNSIVDIQPDGQGKFWLATHEGGMDHFDPQTGNSIRYTMDNTKPDGIGINGLHCIFIEDDQWLWVGGEYGLSRMDRSTGKFTTFKYDGKDSAKAIEVAVFSIKKDRNNNVWFATASGVKKFIRDKGIFSTYLKNYSVKSVFEDASNRVWAGSSDRLFYLDEKMDQFKVFTTPNFPNGIEQVLSILEDNQQNLWVTTSNSIARLNAARDHVRLYNADYGILSSSWNWLNNYKAADGRLFIGGTKGYYLINPEDIIESRIPHTLNFSGLKIGDKEIYPSENGLIAVPFSKLEKIELPYSQNTFTVDFNAIDFHSSGSIKYYYILEEFEKQWHDIGSEHKASFFGLPPGSYTLRIRAINGEGSLAEKKMAIVITPPWWRTWWAYSLYTLLFLSAGWGIYKYQKQNILAKERKRTQERDLAQAKEIQKAYTELKATQAQLVQSEKMASLGELTAGIAHEIQNPLNFVNNFSEISADLINEMKDEFTKGDTKEGFTIADAIKQNLEKILHHGKRADAIVKGMLQHSRTGSGTKEPTNINALAEEYLRLAYHGLKAKDKSFNAQFKTDFDQSIGNINIIPQDFGRVLLNLINNAFYAVHEKKKQIGDGFEPMVTVSTKLIGSDNSPIRQSVNSLIVSVRDNGNGISETNRNKIFQPFFTTKPTGEGTGLGLSLSYDIIKAHGGEIKVESKEGEGTVFNISIPTA